MPKPKLVLIGASTGGPGHLEKILSALPKDYQNTIIIAQHMDKIFMPSLVKRFDEKIFLKTKLVKENERIEDKDVIFVNAELTNLSYSSLNGLHIGKSIKLTHYLPSIDSLFDGASSVTKHFDILACLLTGIGDDGAHSIVKLHKNGAKCFIEDESTCVVYGMPRVANELDQTIEQLPLDKIIQKIKNF